jgi:hypothetical protein
MNSPNTWPELTKRPEGIGRSRRGRVEDGIVALFSSVLVDCHERRGSSRDRGDAASSESMGVA